MDAKVIEAINERIEFSQGREAALALAVTVIIGNQTGRVREDIRAALHKFTESQFDFTGSRAAGFLHMKKGLIDMLDKLEETSQ